VLLQFGERVRQFISGKYTVTGDPLEAQRGSRKDPNIPGSGAVERRATPIESGMLSDGSDTIPAHVLV